MCCLPIHTERQPPTELAGLRECILLAMGSSASYLHAVDRIFHCEVVKHLEQNLHNILSPIEIIIVQHHTIRPGPLLDCALPAMDKCLVSASRIDRDVLFFMCLHITLQDVWCIPRIHAW